MPTYATFMYLEIHSCSVFFLILVPLFGKASTSQCLCNNAITNIDMLFPHSLDSSFAHNEVSGHPALLTYYITVATTTWQQATVGGSYQSDCCCEWCGVNTFWELWFSGSSCVCVWVTFCSADFFCFNNKSHCYKNWFWWNLWIYLPSG